MSTDNSGLGSSAYKEHKKQPFLDAFARIGTISGAARAVHIDRTTPLRWLKNDPEFAKAFKKADEEFTEFIESKIHDKAVAGDLGSCIFLLRSRNPKKYTEKFRHEVTFAQIDKIVGAFSAIIKQEVPQEKWPAVEAKLLNMKMMYQSGQATLAAKS